MNLIHVISERILLANSLSISLPLLDQSKFKPSKQPAPRWCCTVRMQGLFYTRDYISAVNLISKYILMHVPAHPQIMLHTGIAEMFTISTFSLIKKYLKPKYRSALDSSDLLLTVVSSHCLSALVHAPWLQRENYFIFLSLNLTAEMWGVF